MQCNLNIDGNINKSNKEVTGRLCVGDCNTLFFHADMNMESIELWYGKTLLDVTIFGSPVFCSADNYFLQCA